MNTERFHKKYDKHESGCWLWNGATFGGGYGWFFLSKKGGKRKSDYAHRASWKIHRGKIPDGMQVLHRCDVMYCVNPDHLFLGTNLDNIKDRLSKSRPKTGTRGSKHQRAKLTESKVQEIRSAYSGGYGELKQLAQKHGVNIHTMSKAIKGATWRHI